VLAREGPDSPIGGCVTAITDGILSAYIPLLEVLPSHQGHGIGRALMRRVLTLLGEYYMVDLSVSPPSEAGWDFPLACCGAAGAGCMIP